MLSERAEARDRFKTAEGRFRLLTERKTGLQPFNYQRSSRLTLASLHGGAEEGTWIIFNVGDAVNVCRYDSTHKVGCGRLELCAGTQAHPPLPH